MRGIASGTVMRRDAWTNEATGLGGPMHRVSGTRFDPQPALVRTEIDALYRFSALARRIVERETQDAIREGVRYVGVDDQAACRIDKCERKLGALRAVARARKWARAHGGGAVVLLADDGMRASDPLNVATLNRIRGFRVVDRWELAPQSYNRDPASDRIGLPELWMLTANRAASTVLVHHSRVVTLQGLDLPDRLLEQQQGWGGSVLDLVYDDLRNYESTLEYVAELVTLLTQGVFAQAHLAEGIEAAGAAGGEGVKKIVERFEAIRIGMGVLGDIAIDKEREDYKLLERTLTGLKDALDVIVQAVVASSDTPKSILFGEVPGGLNTGSNSGEARIWYDHVAAAQREEYEDPFLSIMRLVLLSKAGPTAGQLPDGFGIEWPPLWQESAKEKADVDLVNAQRRTADVMSQAVAATEVRYDPDLARLYGIDPDAPSEVGGMEPAAIPSGEAVAPPLVGAPTSAMRAGESMISAQDAAIRLGCSPAMIHGMASRGAFPAFRVGARWRYQWSSIAEAIKQREIATDQAAAAE